MLVDEYSASGSEVIAGAIQDHDRGIIIGRRTYGKGLVQEQFNLSNGGALRLTTARYFTPAGRSIQKEITDAATYEEEVYHRSP
ncbi:MAG TPA: S41 family peptidase, partial [Oscillospiraceae bacterium]|nr:S41 family peptidase [Oscillospiraceae bacterium]